MMHLSSFFSLSSLFFFLYFCRSAAATATLAVSLVKRGRPYDSIECPGPLPNFIPDDFPRFSFLLKMCANRAGYPPNLECICIENQLICGTSNSYYVRILINHYFNHCRCGPSTKIVRDQTTRRLNYEPKGLAKYLGQGSSTPGVEDSSDSKNAGSNPTHTHTGSKSCTSINRDCDWFFAGECTCYAPPIEIFFWHGGNCGPVLQYKHSPKRDLHLAQQRRSFYHSATARFDPPQNNAATAPLGPPPDLHAQLASGLLPSPCNASYVSFACNDSSDGIVQEPPQNWLGALLPEGVTKTPPVPKEFMRIHELQDGKFQMAME